MNIWQNWPQSDLEYLGECPICKSQHRHPLFDDLEDWTFRVVPGKWTMWNCVDCATAYLDPRPNEATIGRAYASYFTHWNTSDDSDHLSLIQFLRKVKYRLRWGYYRLKYGGGSSYIELMGGIVFRIFPRLRFDADFKIRSLPIPDATQSRLLDVGCGSGGFLKEAAGLGYEVFGLEPDIEAAELGRAAGVDIKCGSLPSTGYPDEYFAHVTLSHVFEHLHRCQDGLVEIWRILEPGGRLWMAMPNRDASGLEIFGKYWRGLEAPRHLALVNSKTLRALLVKVGFSDITFIQHPPCGKFFVESSLAQKAGLDPYCDDTINLIRGGSATKLARRLDREGRTNPSRAENLVVIATKPQV